MESRLLQNASASSKEALDWAFTWARVHGNSEVGPQDLLAGVINTHEPDSLVRSLFDGFNIPAQQMFEQLGYYLDKFPPSRSLLLDESILTRDTVEIIEVGLKLAASYNAREKGLMRLRDLFGGMLTTQNIAQKMFQQTLSRVIPDVSYAEIVDVYLEYLKGDPNQDLKELVKIRFAGRPADHDMNQSSEIHDTKADPESPFLKMPVSGFNADTRWARDLVGIGMEVSAFSYLIANKDLQPPLAIGLFGNWGSGKTYFMQSLKESVQRITEDARNSKKPQKEIKIFKNIVQIEFNAWHYVEGELWASLVETIFQNLKTRKDEKQSLLQERQQFYIQKLVKLRSDLGAVQVLIDELTNQQKKKKQEILTIQKERDRKLTELNALKVQDVLAEVKISAQDKEKYQAILNAYGVTETYNSAFEFISALAGLKAALERGNALTIVLRQRGWRWTLGVVGIMISGPLVSGLLAWLLQNQIPAVTNALLSISMFLGGLTTLIKAGTGKLTKLMGQVEQAQFELEAKKRQAEKKYENQIAAREQELAEITSSYQKAQAEGQEIADQIESVKQELQQITPRRVLLDFIQERVVSEDYRKRLGIAALIRRDFDQLSDLIDSQNKKFIEEDTGEIKTEDEHLINRIVLYIDDLDRCPPDRVVEVLQAIHLLLAFPLFVVVVAVDSRWLSQSLSSKYEGLLSEAKHENGRQRPATPQNYLEKIFQIPFWVRPLSEGARIRIVEGLVEKPLPKSGGVVEPDPAAVMQDEPVSKVEWDPQEPVREFILTMATEMNPPGLETEAVELNFMEELAPLLGETPRSVKRFVNLYWLMKSIALTQSQGFIDETQPYAMYKQVLLLLAVLTGLPAISSDFFDLLRYCESTYKKEIDEFAGTTTVISLQTLKDLIEVLKGQLRGTQDNFEIERSELDRLDTWTQDCENGVWQNVPVSFLCKWAAQVKRFSYQMEK